MVFRKPYGFLIKHFRLVHLIITAILVYIVSCNNRIYVYLNSCISDVVNKYNAVDYIDYGIFIWMFLAIGLLFVIFWLFKYKDKPRNVYVLSMLSYGLIAVYMFLLFSYFTGLPNNVIDQKVIRAYRDIMLITLGVQYLFIVIMLIRGLGFDIKKFNFTKDIQELDLSEDDAEEVELDVNINSDTVLRGIRKKKREFGYFYQEYKIIILGIIIMILFIVGFSVFKYLKELFKVYDQNVVVGYNNYVSVSDSYYNISDNGNYVIIKFDINKHGKKEKFNVNNMILKIDKEEYLPNKNICYKFGKLGNCYKKQFITNDSKSYILVYEVDILDREKSYLIYNESYDNSYRIKLNLENYE